MEKPDSLITETLLQTRRQSDAVTAISDSALKVVLSYYPVCRCQRTSPELLRGKHSGTFQTTKKLNLAPDHHFSLPAWRVAENHAGTKLSPICSPKCT